MERSLAGEMYLNVYGQIAAEEWLRTVAVRQNVSLAAFVIMPDHMHGIIGIDYQVTQKTTRLLLSKVQPKLLAQ
ncbi:MAG: hypothetical protein AAGJ93_03650 [Bacteroidota bacterium]